MAARGPAWDAVVIGGGPAGSCTAAYLAREGRRVLVVERERFPREHIGESLLPGVLPYLDALGVREVIEQAGFERKRGQTFIWGRDRTPWRIDFRELDVYPYAFFVDRARFDALLLDHAAHRGAEVRFERTVTRVLFEAGRAVGVIHRGSAGDEREERARFVVDASGASALVARTAALRRTVPGLKNVAAWSYWRGARRLAPPADNDILTVSIPEGWIWVIPLGDRTSVGIVTSGATRAERETLGLENWVERSLRACPPVWSLLEGAKQDDGGVRAARDWSYRARRLSGPGILLAGDAACFIDPILSTGVHLAMSSAYWAAATIHSALDEPKAESSFRHFYDETYGEMYRELLAQVRAFYRAEGRRDSVYWASKKILRLDRAVPGDLAFLFITAGLLRNAATTAPHEPLAQARQGLRSRLAPSPDSAAPNQAARIVSPPLVARIGRKEEGRLVQIRQEGMRLRLTPTASRGLRDRPRGSFFALELVDEDGDPLAAAVVDVGSAPRGEARLTLLPYPVRAQNAAQLDASRRAIEAALSQLAGPPLRLASVRLQMRRALRVDGALPAGVLLGPARDLRGGGVAEPALSAVFEARDPSAPPRLYLVVQARVPLELTELPLVRTRFLDAWERPERTRDGREVARIPSVAELLLRASRSLWNELRRAPTRREAFLIAEEALRRLDPGAFSLLACGRLGEAPA